MDLHAFAAANGCYLFEGDGSERGSLPMWTFAVSIAALASLAAGYQAGEKELRWHLVNSKVPAVSLPHGQGVKRPPAETVAYALVYAHAAEDLQAELEVWYRHGMKIWLAGQPVLDSDRVNTWHVQFDRVAVKLKKGVTPILLKVGQYPWGWYFTFRLRAPGETLKKIRLSPEPP